jgi:hypothetical protein
VNLKVKCRVSIESSASFRNNKHDFFGTRNNRMSEKGVLLTPPNSSSFFVELVLDYGNPDIKPAYQAKLTVKSSRYSTSNLENKTQQHEKEKSFMKGQVLIITFSILLKKLLAFNKEGLD